MCVCVRERGRQRWGRGEGEREGGGSITKPPPLLTREPKGSSHVPSYPYLCLLLLLFSCSVLFGSCDPMDCSLPGSSVHGIFWARLQGWVAIFFFRVSFNPGIEPTFLHLLRYKWILYHWATREAPSTSYTKIITHIQEKKLSYLCQNHKLHGEHLQLSVFLS